MDVTKPNTRIPPILLARKTSLPALETETTSYLLTISKQKLCREASHPEPDLRRCLGHHALLTKTTAEAQEDMKRYLEVVEYESDSEDEDEVDDDDEVVLEEVEEVGTFDNLHVKIVDGENEAEDLLFHEQQQVTGFVQATTQPPPGLPVPVSVPVSMAVVSMPVGVDITTASNTHRPTEIRRPGSSARSNIADIHPSTHEPKSETAAEKLSSSTTPSPLEQTTTTTKINTSPPLPPQRPPLKELPSFNPMSREHPSPTPTSTPVKDKILNTMKGIMKRRNSSPSPSSTLSSLQQHSPQQSNSQPPSETGTRPSQLTSISIKNASCSSIPSRVHIHEKGDMNTGPTSGSTPSHKPTEKEKENKSRVSTPSSSPNPSPSPTIPKPAKTPLSTSISTSTSTSTASSASAAALTVRERSRQYAARLGEKVKLNVPVPVSVSVPVTAVQE